MKHELTIIPSSSNAYNNHNNCWSTNVRCLMLLKVRKKIYDLTKLHFETLSKYTLSWHMFYCRGYLKYSSSKVVLSGNNINYLWQTFPKILITVINSECDLPVTFTFLIPSVYFTKFKKINFFFFWSPRLGVIRLGYWKKIYISVNLNLVLRSLYFQNLHLSSAWYWKICLWNIQHSLTYKIILT